MPHDYDFQDDAYLMNTPIDYSFDVHIYDRPHHKYLVMRQKHLMGLLSIVATIAFAIGGLLVKKGIL